MKENLNTITCPECHSQINISNALLSELRSKMKIEYAQKSASEIDQAKKTIREEMLLEKDLELENYKKELQQKSEQVREFNRLKSEFEKLHREKEELKSSIEAEAEVKITRMISEEKQKITADFEERNAIKILEKETLIDSLRNQIQNLNRKIELDGMSTQIQGEAQELYIEAFLKENFPLDEIIEIKKGVRGGDCLQIVNTRESLNCGSIYFESKRTQSFSSQ